MRKISPTWRAEGVNPIGGETQINLQSLDGDGKLIVQVFADRLFRRLGRFDLGMPWSHRAQQLRGSQLSRCR